MLGVDHRSDVESVMARLLCKHFLAVDGTITVKAGRIAGAAREIAFRLQSDGFLDVGADVTSVERAICDAIDDGHDIPGNFSVPAESVAHRICTVMDRAAVLSH